MCKLKPIIRVLQFCLCQTMGISQDCHKQGFNFFFFFRYPLRNHAHLKQFQAINKRIYYNYLTPFEFFTEV